MECNRLWSQYRPRGDSRYGQYQRCDSQEESENGVLLHDIDHPFEEDNHVIHYEEQDEQDVLENQDEQDMLQEQDNQDEQEVDLFQDSYEH